MVPAGEEVDVIGERLKTAAGKVDQSHRRRRPKLEDAVAAAGAAHRRLGHSPALVVVARLPKRPGEDSRG